MKNNLKKSCKKQELSFLCTGFNSVKYYVIFVIPEYSEPDTHSHYDLPVNSHIPGHYDLPPVRHPPSPSRRPPRWRGTTMRRPWRDQDLTRRPVGPYQEVLAVVLRDHMHCRLHVVTAGFYTCGLHLYSSLKKNGVSKVISTEKKYLKNLLRTNIWT